MTPAHRTIRVLVVEDNPGDRDLVAEHLEQAGGRFAIVFAATLGEALERVEAQGVDVALLDLGLPDSHGVETVERFVAAWPEVPVVVLTGSDDAEVGERAVRAGAQDFMGKGRLDAWFVTRALGYAVERHEARWRLEHLNRVLRAIRNVNQLIVQEKDPARLLERTCGMLVETRGYRGAWICVDGRDGGAARVAEAGWGGAFESFAAAVRAGEGPPCRAACEASAEGLVVLDPGESCGDCPLWRLYGHDVAVVVALRYGGRTLGLLGVAFPRDVDVDDQERSLLLEVAGDIAFALHSIEQDARILEAQAENAAIYDQAPVCLLLMDRERRVHKSNRIGSPIPAAGEAASLLCGQALRCLNALEDARGCGYGAGCATCAVRLTVLDTLETGRRHQNVEAVVPVDAAGGRSEAVLLVSTTPIRYAGETLALTCLSDVTEQRAAERARREASERAQRYLDVARVVLVALDREGVVTMINRHGLALLGREAGDVVGRSWFEVAVPASWRDEVRGVAAALFAGRLESAGGHVNPVVTKAGEERLVRWSSAVVRDDAGEIVGLLSSGEDVTAQARAEAAQAKAQRLTASLLDATRAVLAEQDFTGKARGIFRAAAAHVGAAAGYVALLDEGGSYNRLAFLEAGGRPCTVDPTLPMPVRGLRAEAYASGRAVYDNDFVASRWWELMPGGHVALDNVLFAPLVLGGRAVGLIGLANKAGGFDETDAADAMAFAEIAAVALREHLVREELTASEERYRTLVDASAAAIVTLDPPSYRFASGNAAAVALFGLRDEAELKTLSPWDASPGTQPDGRGSEEAARALLDAAMRDGTASFDWRFRAAEGRELHTSVLATRMKLAGRDVVQATVRDVTAWVEAQRKVAELAQVIAQSNDAVVTSDLSGTVRTFNRGAERVFGLAEPDVVGRPIAVVLPELTVDELEHVVLPVLAEVGGFDREVEVVAGDGRRVDVLVSVSLLRGAGGGPSGIAWYAIDISERKRHEREVRASEERFRAVFEGSMDGILIADGDGRLVLANQTMSRMTGHSAAGLLGLTLDDLHPAEAREKAREARAKQQSGAAPFAADLPLARRDGSVLYADVAATPLEIDGRRLLLACFRDATERRSLRASVAQADRLASMGMLAAGVAHEINNPLAYVLLNLEQVSETLPAMADAAKRCYAALLDDRGPDGTRDVVGDGYDPTACGDVGSRLAEALSGARRVREIVRGLGTFSRVEREDVAEVSLMYAIECAAHMAQNQIKYRARLVKEYAKLPPVLASDGRLSQVFLNLLINAADAIEEGDVEGNEIRVRTWLEEDGVYAEVRDTGAGIPREHLERLFEPFFTTKEVGRGSGLGLAICRQIVEGFGGDIRAESAPGEGSRFVVRLPRHGGATEWRRKEPTPAATAAPARALGRVLVVDDEQPIRTAVTRLLRGHEVVAVGSGEEAQALLREDRRFDVIVCDVMMPRMSGMELHMWLAAVDAEAARRVVFVTGGAFTPRSGDYLARSGLPVVEKPFDGKALRALVDEMVAAARAAKRGG